MAKVKLRKEELEETEPEEESVDNKLELLKYLSEVQCRLKDEIGSDYVLAMLGDKDKEAVVEMVTNAYMTRKLYEMASMRIKIPEYNYNTEEWVAATIARYGVDRSELSWFLDPVTHELVLGDSYRDTFKSSNWIFVRGNCAHFQIFLDSLVNLMGIPQMDSVAYCLG